MQPLELLHKIDPAAAQAEAQRVWDSVAARFGISKGFSNRNLVVSVGASDGCWYCVDSNGSAVKGRQACTM
jgi:hypothetical protein